MPVLLLPTRQGSAVIQGPAGYFRTMVVPAFNDYEAVVSGRNRAGQNGAIRALASAVLAAFHMREQLPFSDRPSRAEVETLCSDYKLVGDLANVLKHGYLDRNRQGRLPLVLITEDVAEAVVLTEFIDGDGVYYDTESRVYAELTDGTTIDVGPCLAKVVNFWASFLERNNYLTGAARVPSPSREGFVSRHDARGDSSKLGLAGGITHLGRVLVRRWDPLTHQAVPISGDERVGVQLPRAAQVLWVRVVFKGLGPVMVYLSMSDEEWSGFEKLDLDHQRAYLDGHEGLNAITLSISRWLVARAYRARDIERRRTDR